MEEKSNPEIVESLVTLLVQKFQIPQSLLECNNWNEPLTGCVFGLNGVDLVYLFFEIEKHWQIRIKADRLESYAFNTITNICKVIEETMIEETI